MFCSKTKAMALSWCVSTGEADLSSKPFTKYMQMRQVRLQKVHPLIRHKSFSVNSIHKKIEEITELEWNDVEAGKE